MAQTRELALAAVDKVVLEYSGAEKPVLTIGEVLRTAGDRIQSLKMEDGEVENGETRGPQGVFIKGWSRLGYKNWRGEGDRE